MAAASDSPATWPKRRGEPISLAAAQAIVTANVGMILCSHRAHVHECALNHALGRVLADSVTADRDQPPFDRSTRDGYAVRAADLASSEPLRIVGQLRAGEPQPADAAPLAPGEAVEIMTGAALPPGADSVLMVEHAVQIASNSSAASDGVPLIRPIPGRTLLPGENVVARGSEAQLGEVLLEPGIRLRPEEIALAASCGRTSLRVLEAPRVAILATGDELVAAPDTALQTIAAHQIYDSNSHALAALVLQANAVPVPLSPAVDRADSLTRSISAALEVAPMLLITGGVSAGRYDLVQDTLAELGAEFLFAGVRIQPGKPVLFGRIPATPNEQERYFVGLPGNPVSAMVTFRLFVQPLLAAMSGERDWQPATALAVLRGELRSNPGLTRFLPARLNTREPLPTVTPIHSQGSGDLAANSHANCYLIVPEGNDLWREGDTVTVLLR